MLKFLSKLIYRIIGWNVLLDNYPYHIKKKLIIVAPHTSNWDFPLGILARTIIGDKIKYIGKPELFKPPLSWIMYPLGGIPVKSKKGFSFVDAIAEEYKRREALTIVIAPEGQRVKIKNFKTGFYFISKKAEIAIIPTVFDWKKKEIYFLDPFYPGDDPKSEIEEIESMFRGIQGLRIKDSF